MMTGMTELNKIVSKEILESLKAGRAVHGGDVWSFGDMNRWDGDINVIDFSSNVNPLGPSKRAVAALNAAIPKIPYYPDPDSNGLKLALSEYLDVAVDRIIAANGSTELIKGFCEVFIQKGDRVIIPSPTFSEYEVWAGMRGARIEYIDLMDAGGEGRDIADMIIERIEGMDGLKAIFLCSPNNPTGKVVDGLTDIVETAGEANVLVFLDEAYIEFSDENSLTEGEEYENLFIIRSLTKFFSLAGLRVGYGIGTGEMVELIGKVQVPWNVNTLAQVAGQESIKDRAFIKKSRRFIRKEREFMFSEILKRVSDRLDIMPSDANFFLIDLKKTGMTARSARAGLIEKGFLIRDCSSFQGIGDSFIRVCIRKREENLKLIEEFKRW